MATRKRWRGASWFAAQGPPRQKIRAKARPTGRRADARRTRKRGHTYRRIRIRSRTHRSRRSRLRRHDKTEALQQVHTLARAATEPQTAAVKARASTVRGWFTQVLPTFTGSQKFLAAVHKLVEMVSKFFGATDAGD